MTERKLPPKLAGGKQLECGHSQVLPAYRLIHSSNGVAQRVWCIECEDWVVFAANQATREEAERENEFESRWQFPEEEV